IHASAFERVLRLIDSIVEPISVVLKDFAPIQHGQWLRQETSFVDAAVFDGVFDGVEPLGFRCPAVVLLWLKLAFVN
ncbi:uncharacterized, partial [Tachysurus ichikawai]